MEQLDLQTRQATWTCPTGSSSVDSTELALRTKFQVPALPLANGVTPRAPQAL